MKRTYLEIMEWFYKTEQHPYDGGGGLMRGGDGNSDGGRESEGITQKFVLDSGGCSVLGDGGGVGVPGGVSGGEGEPGGVSGGEGGAGDGTDDGG